jgi:hypothetical protein
MMDRSVSQKNLNRYFLPWVRPAIVPALIVANCINMATADLRAQADKPENMSHPMSVIIDTDIGGDIDDVYAVGLALKSPEL